MMCISVSSLSCNIFCVKSSLWGWLLHYKCNNLPKLYLQCVELCDILFALSFVNCNLSVIYFVLRMSAIGLVYQKCQETEKRRQRGPGNHPIMLEYTR